MGYFIIAKGGQDIKAAADRIDHATLMKTSVLCSFRALGPRSSRHCKAAEERVIVSTANAWFSGGQPARLLNFSTFEIRIDGKKGARAREARFAPEVTFLKLHIA